MKRIVNVDPDAGFCPGVIAAIEKAEEILARDGRLLCLGEMVHNEEELRRLEKKGLVTITHEELKDAAFEKVMFRAHGEPPDTYRETEKYHIGIEDATCPVVLKLQDKVRKAQEEMTERDGQIVIFGKKDHPEVIGLSGNANNKAIVIQGEEDIEKIDFKKPLMLFSQTTMDKGRYENIAGKIEQELAKTGNSEYKVFRTVCGKVANRVESLKKFAAGHDMMVFVSGKNSSNGKFLFSVCREANPESIWVTSEEELDTGIFEGKQSIGVSGATSTPSWLMNNIAQKIRNF